MNNKFVILGGTVTAILAVVIVFVFWGSEARRNRILKTENVKTIQDIQKELETNRAELKKIADQHLEEKNRLLAQVEQLTDEHNRAADEVNMLRNHLESEEDICRGTNEDLDKLRQELARVRKERSEIAAKLESGFRNKKKSYETKILSLDAQLAKARSRLAGEAERYHYNLGALHTRNKDYEAAVEEFKKALGYNPNNAKVHYNLGIMYDDYFKDKARARYHYQAFLELQPGSDDAESVREWLAELKQ